MSDATQYRRKPGEHVTAVQLSLDFQGFTYKKWGHEQHCEPGDWVVDDSENVYTIKREVFERTYSAVPGHEGRYEKVGKVWARVATDDGTIRTKEGKTDYVKGDYIVANDPDWNDVWAVDASKFNKKYERDD